MFEVCKNLDNEVKQRFSSLSRDTNRQESLGRDFQRHVPGKLGVGDVIGWAVAYCENIERDQSMVLQGVDIKYGKRLVRHNLPKKRRGDI